MPIQHALVVASDLHLDRYNWVKHPTLCGDSHESFRQIINYCCTDGVPLLLLGDVFELNRPDSASVVAFHAGMARMAEARQPVYYIQGDHDLVAPPDPPWAGVHPHATHIHRQTIVLPCGLHLYGHDYQPGGMASALESIPPDTNIFATHCGWRDTGDYGATDVTISQVPYASTVFSGHWHRSFRIVGRGHSDQEVRLYSPGSTNMRALDEAHEKHIFAVSYVGGLDCVRAVEVVLWTRPVHAYQVDTAEQLDALVERLAAGPLSAGTIPEIVRKPIVRVRFSDALPEAAARITRAAGDAWHVFLEPQPDVEEVMIPDAEVGPSADGPRSFFGGLGEGLEQFAPPFTPINSALRRLLDCQDANAELTKMYEDWTAAHDQEEEQSGAQSDPAEGIGVAG